MLFRSKETIVKQLFSYHIWSEEFVSDRLKWKPSQPLYLLLLRVYNLAKSVSIPYDVSYSGCQSWIDLLEPIDLTDSIPILDESEYVKQVNTIYKIINHE